MALADQWEEVPVGSLLKGSTPISFDALRVKPDVQAQRDKVSLSMIEREKAANPDDPSFDADIANVRRSAWSGDPFSRTMPNRGSKISAELKSKKADEWVPVSMDRYLGRPEEVPKVAEKKYSDTTNLLAQGAAAVIQGVTYPLDKLLGGSLGKAFEAHVGRNLNDIMNDVQGHYQSQLSPEQQAAGQKEFISDKDGETFGEAWTDPKAYKALIIGNLPSMLPGFGAAALASRGARVYGTAAARAAIESGAAPAAAAKIGQEAAVKAAQRIGVIAGGATEGIIGGGQQGAQTEQEIMGMPEAKLAQSTFYQGLLKTMSPAEARRQISSDAGTQAMLVAGAVDGVTGGAFDGYLAKILTGGGSGSLLREIGRGLTREGATETVQSGGEQMATNQAVAGQADPTRPLMQGVANQAVAGGIAGAAMGAGAGGLGHLGQRGPDEAAAPPQPAAEASSTPAIMQPATGLQPAEPESPTALGAGPLTGQPPIPQQSPVALSPIDQARADAQILKSGGGLGDELRTRNATLVSVYGENAAVRHVVSGGEQFSAIADAMLMAAPTVERVRGTIQQGEQSRDITPDILDAIDELARIKESGQSVAEVLAHGVPHDISWEGQQLLQFLDENSGNPKKIAAFLENYLHEVEMASGVPSEVRGRAFDIIQEREAARKAEADKQQKTAKDEAFAKAEKAAESEKIVTAKKATEQHIAEKVLQTLAAAKASGSGVNPEHQTAMEIAFANSKKLKGKPRAKPTSEPVQGGPSGSPEVGSGQVQAGGNKGPVSGASKTGDQGNARSVRKDEPAKSAVADENRGRVIAGERKVAPINKWREEAARINESLPPVKEGHTRMWRGNRPGEVGKNPSFTTDLAGIALPFQSAYKGPITYVDVPENRIDRTRRAGATDAEFILPPDVAAKARDVGPVTTPVDAAAHEAATSPKNDLPTPTEPQIEAGNYTKGHANVGGLDYSIENPAGSKRRPEWPTLEYHYGYVKGVPARAPDKEHVDLSVKPGTPENYNGPVFVIDQNKADGTFDEPKGYIGPKNEKEARAAYLRNYTKGWESRIRGITEMTMGQFKAKLQDAQAFMSPQKETAEIKVADIPKSLTITLSVTVEEAGESVLVEMNARKAFRDADKRVNRLRSLRDCLGA